MQMDIQNGVQQHVMYSKELQWIRRIPLICEQLGYEAPFSEQQTLAVGASVISLECLSGSRTHRVYTQLRQSWRSV